MQLDASDHAVLGALLGIALGFVRIVEAVIEWAAKKMGNGKSHGGNPSANGHTMMVTLDPESSRMIRETYERTANVQDIVQRRDPDGTPLVYMPRSFGDTQQRTLELVRDVSQSQERV
ncbi:MAG TPA: hypothetical protein VFT74_19875, partial [Isosphaeraceae bacterium]|nr:hypothetical protein [Isosphaeraceae bacterium]